VLGLPQHYLELVMLWSTEEIPTSVFYNTLLQPVQPEL